MTRRARVAPLVVAIALAACGAEDPAAPAAGPPQGILLVTLDTTRADRIGAYGHAGGLTPTIDRLARDGIVFEQAFSVTPITLPSHASILTGLYPPSHGARVNAEFEVGEEARLVSEVFREEGWRTGAFVAAMVLDARYGLDQGFEVYRGPSQALMGRGGVASRPADEVVDDAVGWLDGIGTEEKFFAWVHFFDPHAPYRPPSPWSQRHADPYDGEIAFSDAQLARLLDHIERRGLAENLLVAVTADHGESLGDHGETTHGALLYQPAMRVPLVVAGPTVARARGTRVGHVVSNASLAPTLLALARLPADALPSRVPPLLAPDGAPRPAEEDAAVYLETLLPYYSYRWHASQGLLWRGHKLIRGKRSELYALADDPAELSDLASERGELLAEMEARLARAVDEHGPMGWSGTREVGADERARLASLGYAVDGARGDPFDPELPDPSDRLSDIALVDDAETLVTEWNVLRNRPPATTAWQKAEREAEERALLEEARDRLRRAAARSPDIQRMHQLLGNVEAQLGNFEAAVPLLERAAREVPDSSLAHFSLGMAYCRAGREAEGLGALYRAIEIDPEQPNYYHWLAQYHEERGAPERAAWWIERLLGVLEVGTNEYVATSSWRARMALELERSGRTPVAPEGFSLAGADGDPR